MRVQNLYQARMLVGHFFRESEGVKKLLQEKSGPGINCYNYEVFGKFMEGELNKEQEKALREHAKKCEWCRLLLEYTERLTLEVMQAVLSNKDATEYYLKCKIIPEITDNRFSLARKIRKAWNIL